MVHDIFGDAAGQEVRQRLAAVGSHGDHVGVYFTGKGNDTILFRCTVDNVQRVVGEPVVFCIVFQRAFYLPLRC